MGGTLAFLKKHNLETFLEPVKEVRTSVSKYLKGDCFRKNSVPMPNAINIGSTKYNVYLMEDGYYYGVPEHREHILRGVTPEIICEKDWVDIKLNSEKKNKIDYIVGMYGDNCGQLDYWHSLTYPFAGFDDDGELKWADFYYHGKALSPNAFLNLKFAELALDIKEDDNEVVKLQKYRSTVKMLDNLLGKYENRSIDINYSEEPTINSENEEWLDLTARFKSGDSEKERLTKYQTTIKLLDNVFSDYSFSKYDIRSGVWCIR